MVPEGQVKEDHAQLYWFFQAGNITTLGWLKRENPNLPSGACPETRLALQDLCPVLSCPLPLVSHVSWVCQRTLNSLVQSCTSIAPQKDFNPFFPFQHDPELSPRQFGVELSRLTSEERAVPLLVEKLINYIEMHGLYTEGIYRKSGSTNKIKELRQGLDTGERSGIKILYGEENLCSSKVGWEEGRMLQHSWCWAVQGVIPH